jgi:hypothetical protein
MVGAIETMSSQDLDWFNKHFKMNKKYPRGCTVVEIFSFVEKMYRELINDRK